MRKEEIEKEAIKQCTFKVKGIDGYVDTIDNTQYKGFIAGAQWAEKTMIEKAAKWLDSIMCQLSPEDPILVCNFTDLDELINGFKNYMKE